MRAMPTRARYPPAAFPVRLRQARSPAAVPALSGSDKPDRRFLACSAGLPPAGRPLYPLLKHPMMPKRISYSPLPVPIKIVLDRMKLLAPGRQRIGHQSVRIIDK